MTDWVVALNHAETSQGAPKGWVTHGPHAGVACTATQGHWEDEGGLTVREQHNCPVCGCTDLELLHTMVLTDRYPAPEVLADVRNDYQRNFILFEVVLQRQVGQVDVRFLLCGQCGLIFFSPRPNETDLLAKYRIAAETGDSIARETLRFLMDLRSARARSIAAFLGPHWRRRTGRALDVGGADGHCLGELTQEFECGIVDFEKRDLWPGVHHWGDTLNGLGADDLFDVVMSLHTLEHVPDPLSFLRAITRHLAEGGILYIEVPVGCAGEICRVRNLLTHVNFFSEGSLSFLLRAAGLHVERMASRPVLSRSRYLAAIVAIGRKDSSIPMKRTPDNEAVERTRQQMSHPMALRVAQANAGLVLRRPVQFSVALARRWWRLKRQQRSTQQEVH